MKNLLGIKCRIDSIEMCSVYGIFNKRKENRKTAKYINNYIL
ncbi:MAG: hypothetical protein ACI8WT_000950 [Clostridium sp.]|jgi:hypothetical protein